MFAACNIGGTDVNKMGSEVKLGPHSNCPGICWLQAMAAWCQEYGPQLLPASGRFEGQRKGK